MNRRPEGKITYLKPKITTKKIKLNMFLKNRVWDARNIFAAGGSSGSYGEGGYDGSYCSCTGGCGTGSA
jgi:hypothetical protein